jgi:capsular polysaccharide biosynthesis protein
MSCELIDFAGFGNPGMPSFHRQQFRSQLSVRHPPNTRIISIEFVGDTPQAAASGANAIIASYQGRMRAQRPDAASIRIISSAAVPLQASQNRVSQFALAGFAIGAALGLCAHIVLMIHRSRCILPAE